MEGSALGEGRPASGSNGGNQWVVGLLRATTFIPDLAAEDVVENTWWNEIVGSKPEDERINHQRGVKEQKGAFKGNLLIMVSQFGRVDWTFAPAEDGSVEESEIPALGPMSDDTLNPFAEIVKNWLSVCPLVNRLAFGAILGMPTADAPTGYEEIQPYIPNVRLNPQTSSDFFYQINRPKKSNTMPGVMINRLSRWSVELVGSMGVTVDPAASKASVRMRGQHIRRLELDINTVPLDDTVLRDGAYALFHELVEHGQEIANKGDIQ